MRIVHIYKELSRMYLQQNKAFLKDTILGFLEAEVEPISFLTLDRQEIGVQGSPGELSQDYHF